MENLFGGGLQGEAEKLGEDQLRQRSPELADAVSSVTGRGQGSDESGSDDDDDNGGSGSDDDNGASDEDNGESGSDDDNGASDDDDS